MNPEAVDQKPSLTFETIFVQPQQAELKDEHVSSIPATDSCDTGCDTGGGIAS